MRNFDYNVIINRKKIKNTYLRIDDKGNVIINANKYISDKDIENILISKDKWIKKHLKNINKNNNISTLDKKNISILGKIYNIKIAKIDNVNESVDIIGDNVILNLYDDNINHQIDVTNKFLKNIFINILNGENGIINECREIARKFRLRNDFDITIKLMKSRFGSYSSKTHRICLNYCLVKYDKDIITSVFLHEIAHIKHMNHGKYFYKLLYKMCPDYDKYNYYLKKDFTYSNVWFLE